MDQYAAIRSKARVMSYYNPEPHEKALNKEIEPFERAKAEWIKHAKIALTEVEEFTFNDFVKTKCNKAVNKEHDCYECMKIIATE